MRATGIVRRIDDLGRVVIPKEIRRSMKLKEGEPLEIFTTEDGVVFRKYHQPSITDDIDAILEEMDCFESCEDYPRDDMQELRKALRKVRKWLEER